MILSLYLYLCNKSAMSMSMSLSVRFKFVFCEVWGQISFSISSISEKEGWKDAGVPSLHISFCKRKVNCQSLYPKSCWIMHWQLMVPELGMFIVQNLLIPEHLYWWCISLTLSSYKSSLKAFCGSFCLIDRAAFLQKLQVQKADKRIKAVLGMIIKQ